MYNAGKIIIGIIIFAALFTSPLWLNLSGGSADKIPELVYPTNSKECIYEKDYMRAYHMEILNSWRDKVVREDIKFTTINGKKVEMSLSKTCMGCHTSKKDFCDRCHNYLGVNPYCWDCHVKPEEVNDSGTQFNISEELPSDEINFEHNMEKTDELIDSPEDFGEEGQK